MKYIVRGGKQQFNRSVLRQTILIVNREPPGVNEKPINPLTPEPARLHIIIILCLTPDDFTHQ